MIPASYFFKDMYKQAFEEAAAPMVVKHHSRFIDGMMTPVASAVAAIFHRRDRNPVRRYGVQAYD